MKKTGEEKITKKMLIGDIVYSYPKAADKLINKYKFHCVGCGAAGMETLEEGATVHGMDKEEIKKMVEDLNTELKK